VIDKDQQKSSAKENRGPLRLRIENQGTAIFFLMKLLPAGYPHKETTA
jgi:hypothetical protein